MNKFQLCKFPNLYIVTLGRLNLETLVNLFQDAWQNVNKMSASVVTLLIHLVVNTN